MYFRPLRPLTIFHHDRQVPINHWQRRLPLGFDLIWIKSLNFQIFWLIHYPYKFIKFDMSVWRLFQMLLDVLVQLLSDVHLVSVFRRVLRVALGDVVAAACAENIRRTLDVGVGRVQHGHHRIRGLFTFLVSDVPILRLTTRISGILRLQLHTATWPLITLLYRHGPVHFGLFEILIGIYIQ